MARSFMKGFLWVVSVLLTVMVIMVLFVVPFKHVPVFGSKTDTSGNDASLWNQFTDYITNATKVPTGAEIANPNVNYVGVYTQGGIPEVEAFDKTVATNTNMVMFFKNWENHQAFDETEYVKAYELGKIPVLAWEPWDPKGDTKTQPKYTLDTIISGNHDGYIRSWARAIKDMRVPIGIRFAHEMNGFWYPWNVHDEGSGNSPQKYVDAWRHVHDIFTEEEAINVMWIWSPNVNRYLADTALASVYPGDEYVDAAGMVGYGTRVGETAYDTFGSTIAEIRTFTQKPILITETGAEEQDDMSKAVWINSLYEMLQGDPSMIGFIWFNEKKRANWKVDTSDSAVEAFHNGAVTYMQPKVPPTEAPKK